MKTKLFLFISLLVGAHCPDFFGMSLHANDIDTVWMRWMDISAKHVDISPDAKYIAASDDNSVELYDLQTGTKLHSMGGITRAMFTKDSRYVIGYSGKIIKMIDIESWQLTNRFVDSPHIINRLSYNSDSTKLIASSVSDEGFFIFEITSGQIIEPLIINQSDNDIKFATGAVGFTNNDNEIIYGYGYTIDPQIPSSKSKYVTRMITNETNHNELYNKIDRGFFKISPQRQYYLAWKRVNDKTVGADLINLNNHQVILTINGSEVNLLDFSFSPDDKYVAIAYDYGYKIEIWKIDNQQIVYEYHWHPQGPYWSISSSSDRKYIASTTGKRLYLYNSYWSTVPVTENTIQATITYPNPVDNIFYLEFDLISNNNTTIDLVDLSGNLVKSIENQFLLVGHYSYNVNINDLPSGIYTLRILSGNFSFNSSIIKTN